jgi:cytochrome c oxidase cbb3-type subunit IV
MNIDVDVNVLRVLVTVISFVVFIGIVAWAWSRRNKAAFDEAAQLPFQESQA